MAKALSKIQTNLPVNASVVAASIEKRVSKDFKKLETITSIATREQFDEAAKILKIVKDAAKEAKEEEKKITVPLDQARKAAIAHFKPFHDKVAHLETTIKLMMSNYQVALQKAQQKLDADFESGKIKKISTYSEKAADLTINSSDAKVRKVWTAEIEDTTKIPREFLVPDMTKIREHLAAGGKPIAGVKWYQKTQFAI